MFQLMFLVSLCFSNKDTISDESQTFFMSVPSNVSLLLLILREMFNTGDIWNSQSYQGKEKFIGK